MASAAEPEEVLAHAKSLLKAKRFGEAEAAAQEALALSPKDREALYLAAVAARYGGRLDQALRFLNALSTHHPAYGRGHQERGHALKAKGEAEAALAAYAEAVRLNPALPAAWSAIAQMAADPEWQKAAKAEASRLAALPPELVSVQSMMAEGRLFKAERLCRAFLQKNKTHTEGMRLLAKLGLETGVLDDAEFLLETALALEPGNDRIRLDYVTVLHRRQKFEKALEEAKVLKTRDADNPAFLSAYANEMLATGEEREALAIYEELARRFPHVPENHLVKGHACKTIGDREGAIAAYRAAYGARADYGDAFWSLANLKTYRFTEAEIGAMREAEAAAGTSVDDRVHLSFALGKALEDKEEWLESFRRYEEGNALKRAATRYDREKMAAELAAQAAFFSKEKLAEKAGSGDPAADPIFIVGLPRAGSTLLEQILASHSLVDGTAELPNILATVHKLSGRRRTGEASRYPAVIDELGPEALSELGRDYIENTRVFRQGAPHFTDKMPNNFRHIGLIHMILPNAKIIDARRGAMDCCFSGFKQLFAEGQEFTYGLREIGEYYRGYTELMAHWDDVLPGKILRVRYEEIVSDTEAQLRRILDFLDLPFEEGCLDFHRSKRAVRTASAEQVRRPIGGQGIGAYLPYSSYLDPLREALGPSLAGESGR